MKIQRTLPPTAAPLSLWNLVRALSGVRGGKKCRDQLSQELKEQFSAHGIFLVSSGKAALTVILKALTAGSPRRQVVIPAYTCFSVPSAILKAGLEVVLCDVEPDTLDFNFQEFESLLNEKVLCVLPTHLFGFAADVRRVKRLCQGKGIIVVEDAAQAMGAKSDGGLIGTVGDIAFFSLGRGKNITSGSGGIIITKSAALSELIQAEYSRLPELSGLDVIRNWIKMVAMWCFIHPMLYWLPAGLPFLGLGETKFYTDFPVFRMDELRAAQLQGWAQRLAEANLQRAACAHRLIQTLDLPMRDAKTLTRTDGIYLRLPVLMRDRKTKEAVCKLSQESGAGISPNYPTTIQDIPQLSSRIVVRSCPGAQEIVDRLVTLPTHRFVKEGDIRKLDKLLGSTTSNAIPLSQKTSLTDESTSSRPCSMPMK